MCPGFHVGLYVTLFLQSLLCFQSSILQTEMQILTSMRIIVYGSQSWRSTDKKCTHPKLSLSDKIRFYQNLCPKCLPRHCKRQGGLAFAGREECVLTFFLTVGKVLKSYFGFNDR